MKFCVSVIHLGRYKIEMLDENNKVLNGFDGGSALIMLMLAKWLFEPEHMQYQRDQKANSDQLGEEAITRIKEQNKQQKLLGKRKYGITMK